MSYAVVPFIPLMLIMTWIVAKEIARQLSRFR